MSEVRARVALKVGQASNIPAEIVTFKQFDQNDEHIALVFKQADLSQDAPLVRIHSECLTGDVFHSSRCDCGEQLDETIERMADAGGIILYLRQEGRGIGLYNKIDAYVLQSQGMNTYEANKHLGFGEDERNFDHAIVMLQALSVDKVKLITNNPRKISALAGSIDVVEHISTGTFIKEGNKSYLSTKAKYGAHLISIDK